jgi:hypothetical protein
VVCHTSDPSQGFYFEAMAAHDKLAQKDSVAILSRQLLFIYCSWLCLHTHSLFFGRETKEGQYIGHLLFLPQWRERERDRHTPLIRVIRAPPSLSVWILWHPCGKGKHTHTKRNTTEKRGGGGYGACQYLRFKVASLASRLWKVSFRPCLKRNALKNTKHSQPKKKRSFLFFLS